MFERHRTFNVANSSATGSTTSLCILFMISWNIVRPWSASSDSGVAVSSSRMDGLLIGDGQGLPHLGLSLLSEVATKRIRGLYKEVMKMFQNRVAGLIASS